MKRLISGMEAVRAGLFPCVIDYGPAAGRWRVSREVAATDPVVNQDAYRLWRSSPGYRKACRMLRRSGRRIRNGPDCSAMVYVDSFSLPAVFSGLDCATGPDGTEAWTLGPAVPFQGVDAPPSYQGIERAIYPEWKAELNTETAATILERLEAMKE